MGAHFDAAGKSLAGTSKPARPHLVLSEDLHTSIKTVGDVWLPILNSLQSDLMPADAPSVTAQADLEKFMADSRPLNQAAERARLQERVQRNKQALLIFSPDDSGHKAVQMEIAADEAALAKLAKTAPSAATEIKGLQEAQAGYCRHVEVRKDGAKQAAARAKERRDKRWEYIGLLQQHITDISSELTALETTHVLVHNQHQQLLEEHEGSVMALFTGRIA